MIYDCYDGIFHEKKKIPVLFATRQKHQKLENIKSKQGIHFKRKFFLTNFSKQISLRKKKKRETNQ